MSNNNDNEYTASNLVDLNTEEQRQRQQEDQTYDYDNTINYQLGEEDIQELLKDILEYDDFDFNTVEGNRTEINSGEGLGVQIGEEKEKKQGPLSFADIASGHHPSGITEQEYNFDDSSDKAYRDSNIEDEQEEGGKEQEDIYLPLPISFQNDNQNYYVDTEIGSYYQKEEEDSNTTTPTTTATYISTTEAYQDTTTADLLQNFQSLDVKENSDEIVEQGHQSHNNLAFDPTNFINDNHNNKSDWSSLLQEDLSLQWYSEEDPSSSLLLNLTDIKNYRSVFDEDEDSEEDQKEEEEEEVIEIYTNQNQSLEEEEAEEEVIGIYTDQNQTFSSNHLLPIDEEQELEDSTQYHTTLSSASTTHNINQNIIDSDQDFSLEEALNSLSLNQIEQIFQEQHLEMNNNNSEKDLFAPATMHQDPNEAADVQGLDYFDFDPIMGERMLLKRALDETLRQEEKEMEGPLLCMPCDNSSSNRQKNQQLQLSENAYSKEDEELLLKRIILQQMMVKEEEEEGPLLLCMPCNNDDVENSTMPQSNASMRPAPDAKIGYEMNADVFDSMPFDEPSLPNQLESDDNDISQILSKDDIASLRQLYEKKDNEQRKNESENKKPRIQQNPQVRGKPMILLEKFRKTAQDQVVALNDVDGEQAEPSWDMESSRSDLATRNEHDERIEGNNSENPSKSRDVSSKNNDDKDSSVPKQSQEENTVQTCIPCTPCDHGEGINSVVPQCNESSIQDIKQYAEPMIKSFQQKRKNERQCFGHKENIFGVAFSPCGKYCASASQDSSVAIWDVKNNSLIQSLNGHDKENECLRVVWAPISWNGMSDYYVLATGGADGMVNIWKILYNTDGGMKGKWDCIAKLNHNGDKYGDGKLTENTIDEDTKKGENDVAQIYSLQFIDDWKGLPPSQGSKLPVLITSSDDFVHVWQVESDSGNKVYFKKLMDIRYTHLDHGYGGVFVHLHDASNDGHIQSMKTFGLSSNIVTDKQAYGGDRNPDNLIFVFDAQYCPANNLLGAALSDGTLRLVNGRGVCVTILQLPECNSHLTSFGWDKTGTRLATCVATSHLILWRLHFGKSTDWITPQCQAVLEGGHTPNRPLFGVKYFGGKNEDLLLSWSMDGSLCLWDSFSQGQVTAPLSLLLTLKDYPIYALDIAENSSNLSTKRKRNVAVLGGGRDGGFMGVPLYLYDFDLGEDDGETE